MKFLNNEKPLNLFSILSLCVLVLSLAGCGGEDEHDHAQGDSHADDPNAAAIMAAHKHESANETCFMCDPAKRDKGRLWCREHVRYEDRCWLCHPELEEKDRLYCKGHFLYEDECFLCHPEIQKKDGSASDTTTTNAQELAVNERGRQQSNTTQNAHAGGIFCNEHQVYEIECAICQPDLATSLKPGGSMKIRFASINSADKAGVRTGLPRATQATPSIEALCQVQYNHNTMAKVSPLADGVIRAVKYDVGDKVHAGDVLVELHSAQAATTKSQYLSALVERDIRQQTLVREKRLFDQKIASEKNYIEAQASHRTAELMANNLRQQLINLGYTTEEIQLVEKNQDTSANLVIRAPFEGTIVQRNAVIGEAKAIGQSVFTIADLSTRWLVLSVSSRHIAHVQKGKSIIATFEELPGLIVKGEITWVDTAVDSRSKMLQARALVEDDLQQIKTGLFGKANIITGSDQPVTLVPRDSVQRHEGASFVFVHNEPDLYSIRRVALGQTRGQSVEILDGVSATDPVVTDGSFIVMSEFLKSRLGAGCTDH
ncbi:MAG TPA: efflux RND transporter periplasmic adaptor subunit [Phycisphaerales bacterium]|nr:efflux RND transporter periplasmic adaptor subunit [Phycisphaerales bacterium]HCD32005.1 efflux RND transporter periplasmic adaptor subunit [Phycisphaerales bacterium]|tara:strand:+ start:93688 stop:95319 length:1632 start_codon:yes stop_codon:yes gene_type:complete